MKLYVALLMFLICASANPHHSTSPFDLDREIVFDGTVAQYRWRNPHVYVVVTDSKGVDWTIESDATAVLRRSNWSPDSFKVGDSVSVRANPDKNATKKHALLISITGQDGVPLASMKRTGESNVPSVAATASSLAGIWTNDRARLGPVMRAIRNHPLTEKGQVASAEFDNSMSPALDCIAFPTPFLMIINHTYLMEIEIRDESILLESEFYGATRTIHMDGREHPEDGERTNQGHSIGWWEGNTLVIDTTLFAAHRASIPHTSLPSGPDKHVIERLTLSEDGSQVAVSLIMDDPEYLAEPMALNFAWSYAPHLAMETVDCDPEVARYSLE